MNMMADESMKKSPMPKAQLQGGTKCDDCYARTLEMVKMQEANAIDRFRQLDKY